MSKNRFLDKWPVRLTWASWMRTEMDKSAGRSSKKLWQTCHVSRSRAYSSPICALCFLLAGTSKMYQGKTFFVVGQNHDEDCTPSVSGGIFSFFYLLRRDFLPGHGRWITGWSCGHPLGSCKPFRRIRGPSSSTFTAVVAKDVGNKAFDWSPSTWFLYSDVLICFCCVM